jgi:hypothetical protein
VLDVVRAEQFVDQGQVVLVPAVFEETAGEGFVLFHGHHRTFLLCPDTIPSLAMLTNPQIAARLDDRFRLLVGGSRCGRASAASTRGHGRLEL